MPIRRDKRGRYHVEFAQGGARVHRVLPEGATREQASRYETKLRRELFDVKELGEIPNYTLAEAVMRYLKEYQGRAKKQTENHARRLQQNVVGRNLAEILVVASECREQARLGAATRNRRLAILRRVANLAYRRWGWLKDPLGQKIELLPEPKGREVYLTREQVRELVEKMPNQAAKDAVLIAAYSGLRREELLKLTKEDVVDGCFVVRLSKSGKPRRVPVHPALNDAITRLPLKISGDYLSHAVSRAMPGVRLHDLRHTTASWLIQAGVRLYTVGVILGHSQTQTTARYSHLATEQLEEAVKKIA